MKSSWATEQTNGASCLRISLPQAMGSWPLAQSLFYQYKRTIERAERLRGKRPAQAAATPDGPSSLITNAAKYAPNRPTPAQSREEIWGHTPAPRRLAAARPPQPRESGPASHPISGPGAEGGGGWPMHATAQPWHAEGRPTTTGALRWLHTRSSSAQTKDCKRCKRNSGPGPWSKRMDLTPASTDPCPHGRNARPETPLFSCTFSCRQEKRVLDIAEIPCYH